MVEVSIQVGDEGFRLSVTAGSIRQALGMVEEQYPGTDARVVFPLDPDAFFAADPTAESGIDLGMPRASRARSWILGRQVRA